MHGEGRTALAKIDQLVLRFVKTAVQERSEQPAIELIDIEDWHRKIPVPSRRVTFGPKRGMIRKNRLWDNRRWGAMGRIKGGRQTVTKQVATHLAKPPDALMALNGSNARLLSTHRPIQWCLDTPHRRSSVPLQVGCLDLQLDDLLFELRICVHSFDECFSGGQDGFRTDLVAAQGLMPQGQHHGQATKGFFQQRFTVEVFLLGLCISKPTSAKASSYRRKLAFLMLTLLSVRG